MFFHYLYKNNVIHFNLVSKLYKSQLFLRKSVKYKLRRVATELYIFDLEVKVDFFCIVHLAFLF